MLYTEGLLDKCEGKYLFWSLAKRVNLKQIVNTFQSQECEKLP